MDDRCRFETVGDTDMTTVYLDGGYIGDFTTDELHALHAALGEHVGAGHPLPGSCYSKTVQADDYHGLKDIRARLTALERSTVTTGQMLDAARLMAHMKGTV